MANTIPGGRYQSPDGSWHDANGNPVDAPAIEPITEAPEVEAEQPATDEAPKPAARKRK